MQLPDKVKLFRELKDALKQLDEGTLETTNIAEIHFDRCTKPIA